MSRFHSTKSNAMQDLINNVYELSEALGLAVIPTDEEQC